MARVGPKGEPASKYAFPCQVNEEYLIVVCRLEQDLEKGLVEWDFEGHGIQNFDIYQDSRLLFEGQISRPTE